MFFSEAKKEKGNKGQKKGSLMQKSKIDVTKILIVPFFGSKNHNISAIVFQKAQQKGTIGVAGHHFMIFPPQNFVFTN